MNRPRTMPFAVAVLGVLVSVLAGGCGLQVAGAYRADPQGPGRFGALVGTQLSPPRGHGPIVGGQLAMSDPAREPGWRLRNVKLAAGYRVPWHPLAFELAAESGLGAPMFTRYAGTGVYIGGTLSALVRVFGAQDVAVGLAPGAVLVDAVVSGHGGVWSPPFGAIGGDQQADVGLSVGVRLTVISDLFTANHEGWER